MKREKPALLRMDEAQFRRVKKLIKSLCANYDNGDCLMLDDGYDSSPCPQLITYSLLCKYYRDAVLPSDKELYAEIMGNSDSMKRCGECGQAFASRSKNALYCKSCAEKRKRRSKREWALKNRGRQ